MAALLVANYVPQRMSEIDALEHGKFLIYSYTLVPITTYTVLSGLSERQHNMLSLT